MKNLHPVWSVHHRLMWNNPSTEPCIFDAILNSKICGFLIHNILCHLLQGILVRKRTVILILHFQDVSFKKQTVMQKDSSTYFFLKEWHIISDLYSRQSCGNRLEKEEPVKWPPCSTTVTLTDFSFWKNELKTFFLTSSSNRKRCSGVNLECL